MAEVKLRALGLREVDFGDFDRYLTALTEDGRRIEILCKNARRGKKQNPAARQLCYSEFILSDRGGRYTLRDADLVHSFFALAGDIEKYALSCYLNELTTALTVPDFDNPALCRLLLHALYALEGGKRDPELVKAAFEWRIMAESGYAPDLTSCGVCGEVIENPPVCFSVRAGTAADASARGESAVMHSLWTVPCGRCFMCLQPSRTRSMRSRSTDPPESSSAAWPRSM